MAYQNIFERREIKYLITKEQREKIKQGMSRYMKSDKYGKSTICNIYFDLPDYYLIRHSLEKPVYKEKLRVRSYGIVSPDDTHSLISVKTSNMGSLFKLTYDIQLKSAEKEKQFIDELRCRNGNLEINITQQETTVCEL